MKTSTVKSSLVSVIIPTYNEEKNIGSCLESVAAQSYKKIEVILIDDFSHDNTVFVAEEVAKKNKLDLKKIRNKTHQERGVSRNLGTKVAKGDFILFVDADMQLEEHVVRDCMEQIEKNPNTKAVIIPEQSFGEGFWAKCRKLEKKCYLEDERIEAARFFEKKAFWLVGGWDEKMVSGEDWDLTRRIRNKYSVARIQSFIDHNENNLSLWKVMKKKYYYASVSGVYIEKTPLNILSIIFFIFRPAYLRNWKLILSDPVTGAGMFLLKAAELLAGGAGFVVSKLPNRFSIFP